MAASKKRSVFLKKVVDVQTPVRCEMGYGLIREEVWQDASGEVVRFNLAFINPFLFAGDNGRVLGYDNAHGYCHKHFAGGIRPVPAAAYNAIRDRFIEEVAELRTKSEL